jgi:hypothetical protein
MYLALVRGLWVPYVDPIKYDYQLLSALCWLAASLASKAFAYANPFIEFKQHKFFSVVALAGLVLLVGAILLNMLTLQMLTGQDYLLFRVDANIGYSFVRLTPAFGQQYLGAVQGLGFVLIAFSILWANKDKLPFQGKSKVPATRSFPPSRCETTALSPGR